MDRLRALEIFTAVIERRSFGKAARELGLPPSTVSRAVAALERELDVRLFHRTTRRVTPTDAGVRLREPVGQALALLTGARRSLRAEHERPEGTLRLHAPVSFGRLWIAPELPLLLERFPELRIELTLGDAFVDLVQERVELAIRIGSLADSTLRARVLAENRRVVCASPAYLTRMGRPRRPEELGAHRLLHFSPLATGRRWILTNVRGRRVRVPVAPVLEADNAEVLRTAALAGTGVALLATFLVGDDLRTGRLVPVLDGWSPPSTRIHAVHAGTRRVPARVSVMIEHLARRWGGVPPWDVSSPGDPAGPGAPRA